MLQDHKQCIVLMVPNNLVLLFKYDISNPRANESMEWLGATFHKYCIAQKSLTPYLKKLLAVTVLTIILSVFLGNIYVSKCVMGFTASFQK